MGGVSSRLDYPLKDSLCIAWHILLLFLMVNAYIKQVIIFHYIKKKRVPYSNTISQAKERKKRFNYDTLSMEDKDKYLMQYQQLICQRLSKIVPQDIAFIIVGYYIPNNFIYSKETAKQLTDTADPTDSINTDNQGKTSHTQHVEIQMTVDLNLKHGKRNKRPKTEIHTQNPKGNTAKQMQKHVDLSVKPSISSNHDTPSPTFYSFVFAKPFDPRQPFTNFITFQNWCNTNNQDEDIDRKDDVEEWKVKNKGRGRGRRRARNNLTLYKFGEQSMINMTQIMNRYYLPEHNKQFQDVAMEATIKEAKEADHKWRLIETGYVAFKNVMMLISTGIFIAAFIEWSPVEDTNYLRFIGFILLFHYHPSITSVHMMRWVKLEYNKYGYGVWPCASPCFMPLVMWLERNDQRTKRHSPTLLYFDAELKWITMVNHWIGTYGIWLISIPFVFGGGFWFTHIIWLVYLCLGIIACLLGGLVSFIGGNFTGKVNCGRNPLSGVTSGVLWFVAFFYHTTGIMYIIGFVFHGRTWPAFIEISTGTYCNGSVVSLDTSDPRVLFILIAWIL
eukprot:691243_1